MWRLKKWEDIPQYMQTIEVKKFYDILSHKKASIFLKRLFDIVVSVIVLIILSPVFVIISLLVIIDSPGGAFYLQERITSYGNKFKMIKFRTMVANADKIGSQVTVDNDKRVTRIGVFIRKYRLDEICQAINVLKGDMTFVGTRPEVPKYVDCYTNEMMATLLLPAGITSLASIMYKNEQELLSNCESFSDIDDIYVNAVLKEKMRYNLEGITNFNFWGDIKLMFMTVAAVCGKEYADNRTIEVEVIEAKEKDQESIV